MKIGPLAVAGLLLAALPWRWRKLSNENRVLALLAAAGLAVYGSGVVHLPSLEHLILRAGETLGPYTYVLVGVMAFLETGAFVGLIAPGEFTVLLGGVVAGQGRIDIVVLIGLVWACAVAGDTTSFLLGRRLGRGFLLKHGPKVKITRERLEQVERFFDRHGGKTILIGRFIGLVRAMAPFIAGTSRMPFRRFIPFDLVSAGIWSATFCLLGYVFWHSFDQVVALARQGALALGAVLGVVVGGVALYRYLRVPVNRERARAWLDEQAERPLARPLARVARPVWRRVVAPVARRVAGPARFAWDRITPGGLGLELTTLLAIALVSGYLFVVLAALIHGHHTIPADSQAFDVAGRLRTGGGVDLARALSALGTLPAVAVVTLAASAFLASRREPVEAASLVAGLALTFAGVHITKAAEGRPRPSGSVVDTLGSSFPSGHAAYAVAYVTVAVTLARALPTLTRRAGLVVVAVVLAVVIGLTRVYLRAHYLSDVVGGWALAVTVFTICGMAAMIVVFVRQNGQPK